MKIVVSDTSPINYLVILGYADLLGELFEQVLIPRSVLDELLAGATPLIVREWMQNPPLWLSVRDAVIPNLPPGIHKGEMEAITLAKSIQAPLLIDDLRGRQYGRSEGLEVIGTVGLLAQLGRLGRVDFEETLDRLLKTNFRISAQSLDRILESYRKGSDA